MNHEDDASYKTLFAAPEAVWDLIIGFIPDAWLHRLDYRTSERVSGSYITDDQRDRADDLVWRVKVGGGIEIDPDGLGLFEVGLAFDLNLLWRSSQSLRGDCPEKFSGRHPVQCPAYE